jgi:FMN reductase
LTAPSTGIPRVTAIVGNPKPRSRTYDVALVCARQMADALGGAEVHGIDLADVAPRLLQWGDDRVAEILARMRASSVLVVASPTYKATYTGLLKLLFDQVPAGALRGTVGLPVMVGGAATHSLAVEVHLRPLLVEVGCACPTPGLFVLESDLATVEQTVAEWVHSWVMMVAPLVSPRATG